MTDFPGEVIRHHGQPSVHELADAVREYLHAIDDPRHARGYVDLGEGQNVMDRRAKLDAVLALV